MNRLFKILFIWFIIGMIYFTVEGLWRIPQGGYANIIMLPIGGLCGLLIGSVNQIPKFYNMSVWKQSIIGTMITLIIEYISGYILNIKLGLEIWDYSDMFLNINGQVCLTFGLFWFLLMPLTIWLEDYIRFKFWKEGKRYRVLEVYSKFLGLN